MRLKAILFDLDGTLLPMNQDLFMKYYFGALTKKIAPLGYKPEVLLNGIWTGIKAMVENDGTKTNEEAFWNAFSGFQGWDCRKDAQVFEDFYRNEFVAAKAACRPNPAAKEVVDFCKASGKRVILATNPLFPSVATENRIGWAGLSTEDFELITTYENCHYCKPNKKYYAEILEKTGLTPEECLMVGNNADISKYPRGGFEELKEYLATLL